jgi:hypothetical protein
MERLKQTGAENPNRPQWQVISAILSFEDLVIGLRMVNAAKSPDVKLYELIREGIPMYGQDHPTHEPIAKVRAT